MSLAETRLAVATGPGIILTGTTILGRLAVLIASSPAGAVATGKPGSKRGRGGAWVISSASNIHSELGRRLMASATLNGCVGGNTASANSSQNSATDWCR